MPVTKDDGTVVLALVRGDDRLELCEARSRRSARTSRPATEDEIRAAFGADPGSLGPVGFEGEVVADETLREGQFVAGANRDGLASARRRGTAATSRRASPTSAFRSRATAASRCGGELAFQTAIEVGHIFKLGTRYSVPLEATFLDEDGTGEAARDGELRDRPRRG